MSLFDSVQELYNHELYDEIVFLEELVPSTQWGTMTPKQEALLYVYIADSYFFLEQFNLSYRYYRSALESYAGIPRNSIKEVPEVEARHRFHRCLVKMKKQDEAIAVLSKIPENEGLPKTKFALYKLLAARDRAKETNSHATHLTSVVGTCPSAMFSLSMMLRNGQKITIEAPEFLLESPAVTAWLECQSYIGQDNRKEAINTVVASNVSSFRLLGELGKIYHSLGMKENARTELLKAHHLDDERCRYMDTLANILSELGNRKELEHMGLTLMAKNEESVEAHIAFGYLCKVLGSTHLSKALHVSYKACVMSAAFSGRAKTEAMLLKALVLKDMEKYDEALKHLNEALRYDPCCFELHEAVVNLMLNSNNINARECRNATTACLSALPNDIRSTVLKAKVILKIGNSSNKAIGELQEAQRLLEPIVLEKPYLLDAVWALTDHYERTSNNERAVEILKKCTNQSVPLATSAKLHQKLGEFMAKTQHPQEAYEHMNIAITNGREEASAHISALDTPTFQTPSPVLSNVRCPPPAPRRGHQRSVRTGVPPIPEINFDSSDPSFDNSAMDTSNDTTS